jgi:small-conductance mechanosensitive channel
LTTPFLKTSLRRIAVGLFLLATAATTLIAQQQPTAPAAIPPLPGFAGRDDLILKHLNAIITWYHDTSNQLPTVGLPTDAIYQANARLFALQAVQAAFQSAGADAVLVARANPGADSANATSQDFTRLAPQLDAQIAQIKTQIEAVNAKIASASGKALPALQEQRTRLQGDLELISAEDVAVDQLAKFSTTVGAPTSSNLQRSIAQLERTVPEAAGTPGAKTAGTPASAPPNSTPLAQPGNGLIGEAEALFSQARSLHKIDVLAQNAVQAEDLAKQLRAPLVTEIHNTLNLAAQWAQSSNQAAGTPGPTKQQFDALTARFKQLAAASMPLSQEIIYLDESRANLTQWRQSLGQEYNAMLRSVLTRVGSIALSLAFLTLLSSIWRRFIFRYVHDVRRRRQFLILRRFVVGFMMGLVIILGFVSEFSSLATFAGFITAGLAVGLQTILLSVAAYFFLIGRYGIRVGDRISISGTTGDVIDVGLVRLYIMEVAGTGTDIFPTGRIVVFPNSVLFQATTPLFKQIPGTDYAWHEVAVLLNAGADAKLVGGAMLDAVGAVHEKYRADFERQHAESSRRIDLHLEVPAPSGLLQFAATGLESVVRYPVGLANAAKVDEQVTEGVLAAIERAPELKASINGMPQIRVAVKG